MIETAGKMLASVKSAGEIKKIYAEIDRFDDEREAETKRRYRFDEERVAETKRFKEKREAEINQGAGQSLTKSNRKPA